MYSNVKVKTEILKIILTVTVCLSTSVVQELTCVTRYYVLCITVTA